MSFRSFRRQPCASLLLAITAPAFASAHKTISPQPISVVVGTGLNLNAGIGAVNLQYMPVTPALPFPRMPSTAW